MIKKLIVLAFGVFLSVMLMATVNAAPNDASGNQQEQKSKEIKKKKGSGQSLSKRNKAKIDLEKQKQMRHQEIMKEQAK